MKRVNLILQGKGGVGKSFVATLLAQYKAHNNAPALCIDTDPLNATFAGFKSLNVHHLKIMENDEINVKVFDELIELIAKTDSDIIIDTGSNSFVPFSNYLKTNEISNVLNDLGFETIIHSVLNGGQALLDTVNGFAQLASQMPENIKFVIWLNEHKGQISQDNKKFEEMKVYANHKARISAIIKITERKRELFGEDLKKIMEDRMTFADALSPDAKTKIVERQRLKIMRDDIFNQINAAAVV